MDELCLVYVTASGGQEARRLADIAVSEKLAACANIYDNVSSVYLWKGAVERSEESVIVLKSRTSLFEKLSKKIKENHSYDLPCIVSIPLKNADRDYSEWVLRETSGRC
ncbi:MAG TPA: divalent-cation tolerance protein CutA [Candidatus Omnitrophota bacterium]|nr:divalent-cation tolerance protein CutA [Candidatus Omnitrophota bacterium]